MKDKLGKRLTGAYLAKKWKVNCRHPLYHKDGCWYNNLERFPGALFDPHGYVLFKTEEDYRRSRYLRIGKETNVKPASIKDIPGYVRVE